MDRGQPLFVQLAYQLSPNSNVLVGCSLSDFYMAPHRPSCLERHLTSFAPRHCPTTSRSCPTSRLPQHPLVRVDQVQGLYKPFKEHHSNHTCWKKGVCERRVSIARGWEVMYLAFSGQAFLMLCSTSFYESAIPCHESMYPFSNS